jgi:hypothetical protein
MSAQAQSPDSHADATNPAVPAIPAKDAPAPPILNYASPSTYDWMPFRRRWIWILSMQGIQSLLAIGIFFVLADGVNAIPSACVYALLIMGLQWLLFMPIARPQYLAGEGEPWRMWVSAGTAGLFLGILAVAGMGLLTDFLVAVDTLPNLYAGVSDNARFYMWAAGIISPLIVWIVSTPLVLAFMQRGQREKRLCQISAAIFLGTVIEALASIPVGRLISKKEDCYCATFGFGSLLLAMALGFTVLGPAILLVIFRRRSRAFSQGRCGACGHDMRMLTNKDRCPACGAGWKA